MQIEKGQMTVILCLVFFVLGYLSNYYNNIKVTDDQAIYVEERMKDINKLSSVFHVGNRTKINDWVQLYFNYQFPQGRALLKHEIGNICGISKCDYDIEPINMTAIENILIEVCNEN